MPIYAYKCSSCGYAKDVLQKMSDAPLTECPECGKSTFSKQLTAAGFQLKGSGWYVTDFRGGSDNGKSSGDGQSSSSGKAAEGSAAPAPAPAPAAPAPAPTSSNNSSGSSSSS